MILRESFLLLGAILLFVLGLFRGNCRIGVKENWSFVDEVDFYNFRMRIL
jgi:hypothetical protein